MSFLQENADIPDDVFEAAYRQWLEREMKSSSEERRKRLAGGLGFLEKLFLTRVWWPSFGNLNHLHPEYEIRDFKDGTRFLDFAFLKFGVPIAIEVDAFKTHCRGLTRWEFDDHLDRQNDILIDDWKLLRFSKDKIKDNPKHCQQTLMQAIGKWGQTQKIFKADNPIDQAILQLFMNLHEPVSPTRIAEQLGYHRSSVSRHMQKLSERGCILPISKGKQRVHRYIFNRNWEK